MAAIAVAGFTFWLIIVGSRQHKAAMGALELAADEFNSTHRPKIILREVFVEREMQPRSISYCLTNIGGTKAIIKESRIDLDFCEPQRPCKNLQSAGINDLGPLEFAGGEVRDLVFELAPDREAMLRNAVGYKSVSGRVAYFAGSILYEDDLKRLRRSVFRRRYEPGNCEFIRVESPDNEYAD